MSKKAGEKLVQAAGESPDDNRATRLQDDQTAALLVAQTFIVFSAIYWFLQIESVRELLRLAYG